MLGADIGGPRIVTDPTFDDPGPHGYLGKTLGPAVPENRLGPVGVVLVSHDAHPDNLDAGDAPSPGRVSGGPGRARARGRRA
ncbi:hypothetical protein [Actinomadura rugatobispora]|uniref:Uncharacterized protein n=1 Tax=Actinomadura rugatobispora TaxID=1994 RepID=A0ABW1A1F3_9ACTN